MTTLTAGPQEAQRETRYMPEASSIASGPANPARETLTLRGPEYVSNPELIAMVTRGRIDPESVSGSAWLMERENSATPGRNESGCPTAEFRR